MSVTIDSPASDRGEEAATDQEFESRRSILRRAGALSAGVFAALAARGERAHAHPPGNNGPCCGLAFPNGPWCAPGNPFECESVHGGGIKRSWFCVDPNNSNITWGCGECQSSSDDCHNGGDYHCSYAWKLDGGGCFVAGTPVATPEGERPIEELTVGEEVLAWDLTKRELVATAVTDFQRHEGEDAREVLELTGEHGAVRVTPEHRFFDGLEWTPAAELTNAVHVTLKQLVPEGYEADSRIVPLHARKLTGSHDVYNIHVAHPDHNYLAAGYVVHNVKPKSPMSALTDLWH